MTDPEKATPSGRFSDFITTMIAFGGRGSFTRLAKELGVSDVTIHNWKAGKSFPNDGSQLKIAELFDLTQEDCANLELYLAAPRSKHTEGTSDANWPANEGESQAFAIQEMSALLIDRVTQSPLSEAGMNMLRATVTVLISK